MTAYEETGMSAQARMDGAGAAWPQAEAAPGRRPTPRTPLAVVPAPLPRSGSGVAVPLRLSRGAVCGLGLVAAPITMTEQRGSARR